MGQGLAIRDNLSEAHCPSRLAKTEQFSLRNVPTVPHPTTFQQSVPLPSLRWAPHESHRGWPRAVRRAEQWPSPVAARGSCCSEEPLRDGARGWLMQCQCGARIPKKQGPASCRGAVSGRALPWLLGGW